MPPFRAWRCGDGSFMDFEEFGEDRGPEPQEAAEDVLNGSVNGGSARSVSWADQWTAAEWHEWYEQERLRWELRGQPGSRRESSAWSWEEDRDRGGGADKILVPEFSAEDDRDGVKARGYLRKIEAWRRVTKIKSYKQALMLYNHLTGRAWRDAEELDVEWLDGDSGMDYFIDWIRNRYLDREVIKVGKYMTDFFKNLKKHNNQDVKEFNQEFDQAARLKEVGCALPDVCLAWWYMDKLRLDNATELNLLSSTGNDYNLYKLQDAAIIQDRMNRRLWESHRGRNNDKYDQNKKGQQAYVTEELGEGQTEDEESELDMDVEGIDEEAEEAYVTYQNAKSKYRTIMNARGINPKANQEERIKAAKARSYCSACKKKGHWHKDPECPLNQKNPQGDKRDAHQVKFCHVAYMTDSMTETELYGITDCACSRTVAGRPWIRRMVRKAKEDNIPYFFMAQEENFKFGGPDIFRSERALVVWLQINGAPFILKIAEVRCVLPLLLSRNVLAGLGMCYDISKHVADFSEFGVKGYKLGQTETGHPMVVVTGGGICWPSWPEAVDWSVVECDVHRPARSCYMVRGGAGDDMRVNHIFYPKKVEQAHKDKLVAPLLDVVWFWAWWSGSSISKDFWIETDTHFVRIHMVPRRRPFFPGAWQTTNVELKQMLLESLGSKCEAVMISCQTCEWTHQTHDWTRNELDRVDELWIGRSLIPQAIREKDGTGGGPPPNSLYARAEAMEDEEGRARGEVGRFAHRLRPEGDGAGVAGDPQEAHEQNGGAGQGLHAVHGGRAAGDVQQEETPSSGNGQQGMPHPSSTLCGGRPQQGRDHLRTLQGEDLRGDPDGLPARRWRRYPRTRPRRRHWYGLQHGQSGGWNWRLSRRKSSTRRKRRWWHPPRARWTSSRRFARRR